MKLLVLLFVLTLSACSSEEHIVFQSGDNQLSGVYLSPTNGQPGKAVLLFVHGDGEMPYDAYGYYPLLWDQLRAEGYAIMSWNKPGVRQSTGDWLAQSMADRQAEVLDAIQWVQSRYGFTARQTGVVGFSQAGWVLPSLATDHQAQFGFMVGIGFATNWIEQSRYYTRLKHTEAGATEAEIQAALLTYDEEIALLLQAPGYADYRQAMGDHAMLADRYHFVLKNLQSDARQDYPLIRAPTLLIWGEDDLNVDARLEFERQQHIANPAVFARLIASGNHGLLDSAYFPRQRMDTLDLLKLHWLGESALAPGVIPTLIHWLNLQTQQTAHSLWLSLLQTDSPHKPIPVTLQL
ncbi:alpha/beta hydrolase [Photobacterium sp. WH77]|uniref:alpha/beta hydrolase family protein n=1 Tax=unclassified Photobacterium TaxID=2628852 RepID=UPI001EDAD739|nr:MULTISPECIES: alpha/beta hydrolase [unclassified Photobacterium]MCG2837860.1 alpha/beta hydrolase [Photobacterium sp. WH77]MCG2845478.1 alpha/beta hydrolase [Photobacterium sp. WH80]